ncbi:MAG: hypothetical protein ACRC80_08550 [Waterburya sp.]
MLENERQTLLENATTSIARIHYKKQLELSSSDERNQSLSVLAHYKAQLLLSTTV